MLIDSKGKLFGKVSVVDILIVVMVLGVIAGVGYKFTKSRTTTPFAKKDTIKVTFYQPEIDNFLPDNIKNGDIVRDVATGSVFGKVVSYKTDKAISAGTNSDGQWVQSSRPNYVSITLEVEGQGVFKDGTNEQGVTFDNIDFFIGKSLELRVGNEVFYAKIKNLEKKG